MRPRRTRPTRPLLFFVVLALLLASRLFRPAEVGRTYPDASQLQRVERVVDGDTLLLESRHRVRLIGVDTPETKHPELPPEPFGEEASQFVRDLVEGKSVHLEYDRERFDRYDRVLAYVYVGDLLLNEELIREGLSPAVTKFPYRSDMRQRFVNAEKEAQQARRGLWSLTSPRPSGTSGRRMNDD